MIFKGSLVTFSTGAKAVVFIGYLWRVYHQYQVIHLEQTAKCWQSLYTNMGPFYLNVGPVGRLYPLVRDVYWSGQMFVQSQKKNMHKKKEHYQNLDTSASDILYIYHQSDFLRINCFNNNKNRGSVRFRRSTTAGPWKLKQVRLNSAVSRFK